MDMQQARFNMVEQQIRPWNVLNQRVLDSLYRVDRSCFVPANYRNLAYADTELPLGYGQTMSPPRIDARFLQEIMPTADETVLEIGAGSGYLAALLATQAKQVTAIELVPELVERAQRQLAEAGFANVTVMAGNGLDPQTVRGQFDGIVLSGSLADAVPDWLFDRLHPGGRLVAVIGVAPVMTAITYRAGPNHLIAEERLFETVLPPLAMTHSNSRVHRHPAALLM